MPPTSPVLVNLGGRLMNDMRADGLRGPAQVRASVGRHSTVSAILSDLFLSRRRRGGAAGRSASFHVANQQNPSRNEV